MPTPPTEIQPIFVKAAGLSPLRTVIDPALFSFPKGALEKKLGWAIQVERAEELRLKRDPIVTWHYKGGVAVLAQWGDSPIERKLVELVASQPDLI